MRIHPDLKRLTKLHQRPDADNTARKRQQRQMSINAALETDPQLAHAG
jgi:hypothetical protein